jgi:manganese/zinc/iron transport system substrate-binding protein
MKIAIAILLLAAAALLGCDGAEATAPADGPATGPANASKRYTVVATVGMVRDIVEQVAGERAQVHGLMGSGIDPHLYKPSRNDVAALIDADVVFYSGLMLEGKMNDTFMKLARDGKPVYAVTERIEESFLLQPPAFAGHHDPHVWMSVPGWMKAVDAVAKSLREYDPPNATDYSQNAVKYLAELQKLDAYARKSIGSIPQQSRILVTAHDAFNYFGREYSIEVKGIQGISTESEAGLQDINALVNLIVSRDVKAVFVESSVAQKNIRALVDGAAARGKQVVVGGSLFSDAMGPPGTYEGTYIGMMDHNVTVITRALGGEAPAKGMQGKLK